MAENIAEIVLEKFRSGLAEKGMAIANIDPDGLIQVSQGETMLRISLDNLIRNYERDRDDKLIAQFIGTITNLSFDTLAGWEQVKDQVYVSLLPLKSLTGDPIYQPVTMIFGKAFVYTGGNKLTWIDYSELERWKITLEELEQQAGKNADLLLEQASVRSELVNGRKLGMIELPFTSLKTAMLFAPAIRSKIEPEFGFPFYAVIPVRDFCYIFSEEDFEFFTSRIGQVIVDEYKKSAYPLTTEVLRFDGDGVEAAGEYPAG